MNWKLCMIIALMLFLASIIIAVIINKKTNMKSNKVITPYNTVFAGLFFTTLVLMLPVYYSVCSGAQLRLLKTVLFAIQGTFQVFTIDADTSLILENIPETVGRIAPIYSAIVSFMFVLAPIFTFGFLISFFKNASAYFQLFFKRWNDIYVFSELNEKSIALAEDIKNNNPSASVVFTDVFENNEEESYELIERAKKLGGICFKKDILAVNLKIHSASKQMYLFAIGANESENIKHALKLINIYGSIPKTSLYVFTTGIESELLLTHSKGIPMKVRRINEVQSLINRVLYERGDKLFKNAVSMGESGKKIHAVIVGLGRYGTEMLKALTWYCQMDGYHIEIDAFDEDELAKERITALCPELMSENYNGVSVPGEAEYRIRIHSGVNVDTKIFADSIQKMRDITYAFVSLGLDEKNIKNAVNLRMLFERSKINPEIYAVINNSEKKWIPMDIKNFSGQNYNIECIGDIASSYSESVIINSELEADALKIHLKWGKEEEFWQYEYNYRSSMASAIHMKARIACKIPGADKFEKDLSDEEKNIIEVLEHRRWNAYMRAEGYIYSGSIEKDSRNDLAKMHNNLVDFSILPDEIKRIDSKVGSR